MANHTFDQVAPFYDALARLIFGNILLQAQTAFLLDVPAGSRVLIIGGGTGQILTILLQQGNCREIVFLEVSEKMLQQARTGIKDQPNAHQVSFRLGTEAAILPGEKFDVIMTHFFLDLFSDKFLPPLLTILHRALAKEGYWVATDFVIPKELSWQRIWAKILLKIMYIFFGLTCRISAKSLPDWEAWLRQYGLEAKQSRFFYHGLIRAALFIKNK